MAVEIAPAGSPTVERSYADILEFLDEYRTRLRGRRALVPGGGDLAPGAALRLRLRVPVLDRAFEVPARVEATGEAGAVVVLEGEGVEAALGEVDAFYQLAGRLMRALLQTGRFRVAAVGEAARPAGPAPVAAAVPSPAAVAAAPPAAPAFPGAATPAAEASRLPTLDGPPTEGGDVAGARFRDLLMRLYREQRTGILEVRMPDGLRRVVFVEKGGPVQFLSEPPVVEETLGMLLLRAGRIDEAQLRESLERMNRTGQLQGEALVEMNALNFASLVMALGRQAELICRNVAGLGEGRYAFHEREKLDRRFISPPVKIPAILWEMRRTHYRELGQEQIDALLHPLMDCYVVVAGEFPWADLRMKRSERDLVDILKKRNYRVREIYSVSSVGRAGTTGAILTLRDLGLVEFTETEDVAQADARTHALLAAKLDAMEGQNHFDRMEIHWSARDVDVENGYARLVRQYETLARRHRLNEEQERMRQEVLRRLAESHAVLKVQSTRHEHRLAHYEVQQCEFSADLLFRQGEMLAVKQRWPAVIENFERAAELQPQNRHYSQAAASARNQTYKSSAEDDD